LAAACEALDKAGLIVRRRSHAWRSAAWPDPTQPPFTNAVVEIAPGDLTPQQVMARLHRTERMIGRKRGVRNAPRTLDLDLIAWGNAVISDPKTGLVVPHPRLHVRAFVLAPLSELDPKWWHPSYDVAITSLLVQSQVELPAVRTKHSDKLAQSAE
jgi:2-amino-4-hydroxy-6-hydroxymethyldihydropteridine diphosphokinase